MALRIGLRGFWGAASPRALSTRAAAAAAPPPLDPRELELIAAQQQQRDAPFALTPRFLEAYRHREAPFGFGGLGEFVYATRYSRLRPDGSREAWHHTVERVVNGTLNMQRRHALAHHLPWDATVAQHSARDLFERIFQMKMLPPGRGLWAMGTPLTEERHMNAALNNCAFVSTQDLPRDPVAPFAFLMDAAMLGVGVGFDTDGAGSVTVAGAAAPSAAVSVVGDSREGWVDSVAALLRAHFEGSSRPRFDYAAIRPRGAPIKGFGGVASGPELLQLLHAHIDDVMAPLAGQPLSITAIVDIMNGIGKCIVSGDVRQTAEIAFGPADSTEFLDLKDYAANPRRAGFGWTSNNSIYARLGRSYDDVCKRVAVNGEPGFAWLENMRSHGRMADPPTHADARVKGGNPCLEQSLESYELCCLVEVFPTRAESIDDFLATLRAAFTYAKTVTLGQTHWRETNAIMARNRRIGTSLSGLAQFLASRGPTELRRWCDAGYAELGRVDAALSEAWGVPRSVKRTSIKPSGTVSLLAGATPGIHAPESRFYLRRVRLGREHELVAPLLAAGYTVEPAAEDPQRKVVVAFPVDAGAGVVPLDELSMWEQLERAALLQHCWADNQVSATITFDPVTEAKQLPRALDLYQHRLKGVSFLPRCPTGVYQQLPYEAISEAQYAAATAALRPLDLAAATGAPAGAAAVEPLAPRFCSSDACEAQAL